LGEGEKKKKPNSALENSKRLEGQKVTKCLISTERERERERERVREREIQKHRTLKMQCSKHKLSQNSFLCNASFDDHGSTPERIKFFLSFLLPPNPPPTFSIPCITVPLP